MSWSLVTLAHVCEKPQYGAIAKGSDAPIGPRFVRQTDITSGRIDWSSVPFCDLPPSDFEKFAILPGDVLISRLGNGVGNAATVRDTKGAVFAGYLVRFQARASKVDPTFIGYQLQSDAWRQHVSGFRSGAAQPTLNAQQMGEFQFLLPPLHEQRAIAATLGALDDKIESNRRAQVTGENLIRSLVTAALERSTGEIGVLSDYCNLVKEPARTGALTADLHYIAFEHMPRGSIFLDDWGNAEGLGSDKSYFRTGDVLFGKLRPYFKKVGIAPVDGVCSTDILVLRPIRQVDTAVVATVASSDPLIDSLSAAATGTRMPRASWKDLSSWPVLEMTAIERDELADQVDLLVERLTALTRETKRLQLLRDALLPELLLGRIRISEAVA